MPPPPITHVLETILYVKSMSASVSFYKDVLRLTPFLSTPRLAAFALQPTTLLLFQLGGTAEDNPSSSGVIPGHGPTKGILDQLLQTTSATQSNAMLKQHFCLAVPSPSDVDEWDKHLQDNRVVITGRMNWERSGKSVYFVDPDGHVGEIGSRGIWPHY